MPGEAAAGLLHDHAAFPAAVDKEQRTLTLRGAAVHLFKGNVGPGVLALPLNFQRVGPLAGLVITAVVALQGIFSMVLLLRVQRGAAAAAAAVVAAGHRDGEALSFEEVGFIILGSAGRVMVQTTLAVLQLGVCAVFISFCTTALRALLPLGRTTAVFLVWGACSLLALLPTLRSLVPLSIFGSICMLLAVGTALAAAVADLMDDARSVNPPPQPDDASVLTDWGSAFAATFYAFEGIGLVLPIENQLAPNGELLGRDCGGWGFAHVLCGTLNVVALLFAAVGCLCSAAFPRIDSASVTAFLASRGPFFEFVNALVASAVLLTFPLQLTPASQVIEGALGLRGAGSRRFCRLLLVAGCALLVLILPSLDLLIDVMGSCANTVLAGLPCLFHATLTLRSKAPADASARRRRAGVLALDVSVMMLCAAVMGFGLRSAMLSAGSNSTAT